MAISFDFVPNDIRVPGAYFEISNTNAVRSLPGMPSRILVHGQMLPSGTATPLVPIQIIDARRAEGLFGRGSQLHRMFAALKKNNSYTETWAIPQLDSGAGVAAGGIISFGGTVTLSGTLNVYIAGQRVRVAVSAGESAAETAGAVAQTINLMTDLPVTASAAGSQVSLAARHRGINGNFIDVRVNYYSGEDLPRGRTVTITPMSGGSGNPDIGDAIASYGDTWWTDIIVAWTDPATFAAIEEEVADRFGPLVMRDAHVYTAASGSHATLTTLASARNSPHVTILGVQGSPTPPEEWAAALGAVCAYYSRLDQARPLQTLAMQGLLPPVTSDRFTWAERNLLLFSGIATFTVDDAGVPRTERVITTYQTNNLGVDDISYLDLETLKTVAYIRYVVRARIALRFPRHKLANDGTQFASGQAIVTPSTVRGELLALFRELEDVGIVEGFSQFKQDLIVERDLNDPNRVNCLIPPDIINQLRVVAGSVKFLL